MDQPSYKFLIGEPKISLVVCEGVCVGNELHFALSSSTGTLTLCCTRLAVVPKNRSAKKRWPWVLIATRSQPFCFTQRMISFAGSPYASSASAEMPDNSNSERTCFK